MVRDHMYSIDEFRIMLGACFGSFDKSRMLAKYLRNMPKFGRICIHDLAKTQIVNFVRLCLECLCAWVEGREGAGVGSSEQCMFGSWSMLFHSAFGLHIWVNGRGCISNTFLHIWTFQLWNIWFAYKALITHAFCTLFSNGKMQNGKMKKWIIFLGMKHRSIVQWWFEIFVYAFNSLSFTIFHMYVNVIIIHFMRDHDFQELPNSTLS